MGRPNKMWWHASRGCWYCKLNGKAIRLGEDRSEALRAFHRLMAERGLGEAPRPATMRLADVIDLWLVSLSKSLSPRTIECYGEYGESLSQFCGGTPVANLKPSHLQKWLDANPGWKSEATRHLAISIAKIIGRFADTEGYVTKDPFQRSKRPRMPRRTASTKSDVMKLVDGSASVAFENFVNVALETGCRPGELMTLEAIQVRWEDHTATVRGKGGERQVHLSEVAIAILRKAWESNEVKTGPVLRNTRGQPWTSKAIQCQYRRRGVKVGVRVVPYQTRGVFATEAIRSGMDSIHVSGLLGHKSVAVLEKHYADIKQQDLMQAMKDRDQRPPAAEKSTAVPERRPPKRRPKPRKPAMKRR